MGIFISSIEEQYHQIRRVSDLILSNPSSDEFFDMSLEVLQNEREIFESKSNIVLFESKNTPLLYECTDCLSNATLFPISITPDNIVHCLNGLMTVMEWEHIALVSCESQICISSMEWMNKYFNYTMETVTTTVILNDEDNIDIDEIMERNSRIVVVLGAAEQQQRLVYAFLDNELYESNLPQFVFLSEQGCSLIFSQTNFCFTEECLRKLYKSLFGSLCIDRSWEANDEWMKEVWNPISGADGEKELLEGNLDSDTIPWADSGMNEIIPIIWDMASVLDNLANIKCNNSTWEEIQIQDCVDDMLSNSRELYDDIVNTPFEGILASNLCSPDSIILPLRLSYLGTSQDDDGEVGSWKWEVFSELHGCKTGILKEELELIHWPNAEIPVDRKYLKKDDFIWTIDTLAHCVGFIISIFTLCVIFIESKFTKGGKMRKVYEMCVIRFKDAKGLILMVIGLSFINIIRLMANSGDTSPFGCFTQTLIPPSELLPSAVFLTLSIVSFNRIIFNNSLEKRKPFPLKKKLKMSLSGVITCIWRFVEVTFYGSSEVGKLDLSVSSKVATTPSDTTVLYYDKYCEYSLHPMPLLLGILIIMVVICWACLVHLGWYKGQLMATTNRLKTIKVYTCLFFVSFVMMILFVFFLSKFDDRSSTNARNQIGTMGTSLRFLFLYLFPNSFIWGEIFYNWKRQDKKRKQLEIAESHLIPEDLFEKNKIDIECLEERFESIKEECTNLANSLALLPAFPPETSSFTFSASKTGSTTSVTSGSRKLGNRTANLDGMKMKSVKERKRLRNILNEVEDELKAEKYNLDLFESEKKRFGQEGLMLESEPRHRFRGVTLTNSNKNSLLAPSPLTTVKRKQFHLLKADGKIRNRHLFASRQSSRIFSKSNDEDKDIQDNDTNDQHKQMKNNSKIKTQNMNKATNASISHMSNVEHINANAGFHNYQRQQTLEQKAYFQHHHHHHQSSATTTSTSMRKMGRIGSRFGVPSSIVLPSGLVEKEDDNGTVSDGGLQEHFQQIEEINSSSFDADASFIPSLSSLALVNVNVDNDNDNDNDVSRTSSHYETETNNTVSMRQKVAATSKIQQELKQKQDQQKCDSNHHGLSDKLEYQQLQQHHQQQNEDRQQLEEQPNVEIDSERANVSFCPNVQLQHELESVDESSDSTVYFQNVIHPQLKLDQQQQQQQHEEQQRQQQQTQQHQHLIARRELIINSNSTSHHHQQQHYHRSESSVPTRHRLAPLPTPTSTTIRTVNRLSSFENNRRSCDIKRGGLESGHHTNVNVSVSTDSKSIQPSSINVNSNGDHSDSVIKSKIGSSMNGISSFIGKEEGELKTCSLLQNNNKYGESKRINHNAQHQHQHHNNTMSEVGSDIESANAGKFVLNSKLAARSIKKEALILDPLIRKEREIKAFLEYFRGLMWCEKHICLKKMRGDVKAMRLQWMHLRVSLETIYLQILENVEQMELLTIRFRRIIRSENQRKKKNGKTGRNYECRIVPLV